MSHPRINSCSDQITEHCVRAPLLCICYVIHLYCYYCCVFIVSSPSYCSVDPTSTNDAPVIDYFVDDRTPTVELPGKQSHSLPRISPTFPYFLALGIVTVAAMIQSYFNC